MVAIIIIVVVVLLILMGTSSSSGNTPSGDNTQPQQGKDRSAGTTEDTALPLGKVLPFICSYKQLDDDIKYNFEKNPYDSRSINYRTLNTGVLEYPVFLYTTKGNDGEYSCDYTLFSPIGGRFMIFFNIYDLIEDLLFLQQIRVKKNGVYEYRQTSEAKQKVPTFFKLMNNAAKVDKELVYGLPFLSFLDAEQKYPLLAVWFHESSLEKEGDMDKMHIALWKILQQLIEEMQNSGILTETKNKLVKNIMKIGFMLNRIS
ncbi:MAG: hypothetical protein IKZ14_09880 [Muribaculaceae bacterium]|nr:hypothetical protein [Muribaculaceae bacterium]